MQDADSFWESDDEDQSSFTSITPAKTGWESNNNNHAAVGSPEDGRLTTNNSRNRSVSLPYSVESGVPMSSFIDPRSPAYDFKRTPLREVLKMHSDNLKIHQQEQLQQQQHASDASDQNMVDVDEQHDEQLLAGLGLDRQQKVSPFEYITRREHAFGQVSPSANRKALEIRHHPASSRGYNAQHVRHSMPVSNTHSTTNNAKRERMAVTIDEIGMMENTEPALMTPNLAYMSPIRLSDSARKVNASLLSTPPSRLRSNQSQKSSRAANKSSFVFEDNESTAAVPRATQDENAAPPSTPNTPNTPVNLNKKLSVLGSSQKKRPVSSVGLFQNTSSPNVMPNNKRALQQHHHSMRKSSHLPQMADSRRSVQWY